MITQVTEVGYLLYQKRNLYSNISSFLKEERNHKDYGIEITEMITSTIWDMETEDDDQDIV